MAGKTAKLCYDDEMEVVFCSNNDGFGFWVVVLLVVRNKAKLQWAKRRVPGRKGGKTW
jgi:hypothetical protein